MHGMSLATAHTERKEKNTIPQSTLTTILNAMQVPKPPWRNVKDCHSPPHEKKALRVCCHLQKCTYSLPNRTHSRAPKKTHPDPNVHPHASHSAPSQSRAESPHPSDSNLSMQRPGSTSSDIGRQTDPSLTDTDTRWFAVPNPAASCRLRCAREGMGFFLDARGGGEAVLRRLAVEPGF